MADVEMKPTDESKKEEKTDSKKSEDAKEEPKKQPPSVPEEIKTNIALIERAVSTFEPRFTLRVLRTLASLRKRLNDKVLIEAIELVYPPSMYGLCAMVVCTYLWIDSQTKHTLISWVPKPEQTMDVDASAPAAAPTPGPRIKSDPVPEAEIYLRLLILHHLLTNSSTYPQALKLAGDTLEKMQSLNRRTMDPIAAKIWFAVDRAYELAGNLADARP